MPSKGLLLELKQKLPELSQRGISKLWDSSAWKVPAIGSKSRTFSWVFLFQHSILLKKTTK